MLYERISKTFRTGHLEREMQMVQLYATRCNCTAILCVSLVSFANIILRVASQWVFVVVIFLWLSPENFGYTVYCVSQSLPPLDPIIRRQRQKKAQKSWIPAFPYVIRTVFFPNTCRTCYRCSNPLGPCCWSKGYLWIAPENISEAMSISFPPDVSLHRYV